MFLNNYCFTHCCYHCPHCPWFVTSGPQFWCNQCQRYTYHRHYHHPVWPTRPTIINRGAHERDRATIAALAG